MPGVLRWVAVQPEAQQGEAVRPAVELQEGAAAAGGGAALRAAGGASITTSSEFSRDHQTVAWDVAAGAAGATAGATTGGGGAAGCGPRLPKQESRQRRRSHDPYT
jgi:hypothetical protein